MAIAKQERIKLENKYQGSKSYFFIKLHNSAAKGI